MLRTNMARDRLKLPALPLTAATARRVAELVLRTFEWVHEFCKTSKSLQIPTGKRHQ